MAHIIELVLYNFRNFIEQHVVFDREFTFIFGPNASGKTSLLEALYLLSSGKSFRTSCLLNCISHASSEYVVRAQISNLQSFPQDFWLASRRARTGGVVYKVAESVEGKLSNFAKHLPVQFVDINSYKLIEEGPSLRREYLDWLLFYTTTGYAEIWQRMQKSLEQRNMALKAYPLDLGQLALWTKSLVLYANMVNKLRQDLVIDLTRHLTPLIKQYFSHIQIVSIIYIPGWDVKYNLEQALELNLAMDIARKNTSVGPHKADLLLLADNLPVKEVFSRGQVKLLVCLMMLARLQILKQKSVFLIDDLSAELDQQHIGKILMALASLNTQVIVTALDYGVTALLPSAISRQSYILRDSVIEPVT